MFSTRLWLALALALYCRYGWAEETGAITPYRPSVSNPAQLSLPGQLEFELGGIGSRSDAGRRDSLPYLLKLAFTPQWGLLIGGEAYVAAPDANGTRAHGLGDTTLTLKRAFLFSDATAFGIELGAKLPTARDAIGSGRTDYTLNGIYSQDLGKLHFDGNANLTRLGAADPGTSSMQAGLSASLSMPINDRWGVTAELSGTRQSGAASTAQWLAAATYSPNQRLTFDIGMLKGLNHASPDWAVFGGVVFPIAKLW